MTPAPSGAATAVRHRNSARAAGHAKCDTSVHMHMGAALRSWLHIGTQQHKGHLHNDASRKAGGHDGLGHLPHNVCA